MRFVRNQEKECDRILCGFGGIVSTERIALGARIVGIGGRYGSCE